MFIDDGRLKLLAASRRQSRRAVQSLSVGKIPFSGNRDFGSTSRRKCDKANPSVQNQQSHQCFTGKVSISEAMADVSRPRPLSSLPSVNRSNLARTWSPSASRLGKNVFT
jgi:hypothetical protein